jgi:outer membrane biosynthesis protein TonB
MIEPKQVGGKLVIDYFSKQDVEHLLDIVNASLLNTKPGATAALDRHEQKLNNENKTEHKMAKPPENLPNDSEPEQKPIQKPGQTITSNDTSADNNKDTSADPFAYLLEDRSASSDDYSDSNNPPKTSPYQSTNELLQADSNDVDSDDDYGLSSFSV